VTEGSVTTRHDMTARHRHDVAIDNPGSTHDNINTPIYSMTNGTYINK
jgi:hypothetical protein